MSTEAQRLISVSLTKIAQSRSQRGGVSLHKNLLVATVLQRARYIFMEEAYHMVQVHSAAQPRHPQQPPPQQPQQQHQDEYDEEGLVALTAEEAGCESTTSTEESSTSSPLSSTHLQEFLPPSCERCCPEEDKENQLPPPYTPGDHPTYLDLDKEEKILKERTNSPPPSSPSSKTLKRRRVAEWETEEAVSSILPKRVKSSSPAADAEESVFLDDASLNSDSSSDDDDDDDDDDNGESSMEIDRITSLVSIFSFGGLGDASIGKLTRSVSTPDLCSSQAKEGVTDSLQQRPFLAMTV